MSKKRLRITPQGWLVLAAIVILIAALIIILIVLNQDGCAAKETGPGDPPTSDATTPDPNASSAPTQEPTEVPTQAPTEAPTIEPLSKQVFTEPTAEMISYAVAGTTNVVGATLRSGPGTDFAAVETRIANGSALTIYQDFGQWVFCQVDALQKFGYINRKFVTPANAMYMPTTDQPPETYIGTINVNNTLTLRSAASTTSEEVNNYYSGQVVYIHYISGEFYYVTCAGSGETGYMASKYITTSDVIPIQPAE